MRGKRTRFGAGLLVVVGLLTFVPVSAAIAATEVDAGFDQDPFEISGEGADARGAVEWSRGDDPGVLRGSVSGSVRSSGGKCVRVEIAWLNSANSTIRTSGARICGAGSGGGFGAAYASSALECVRIRLLDDGTQIGATRLLCAGGT